VHDAVRNVCAQNYLDNFEQSVAHKLIAQMNTKVNVVGITDESVDKL